MRLVDDGVSFVVEGAEGAEVDKALGFNKRSFVAARLCFTSDSFSLFSSYYFLSASFIDRQYSSSSGKVASSRSRTLSYLCVAIRRALRRLRFR